MIHVPTERSDKEYQGVCRFHNSPKKKQFSKMMKDQDMGLAPSMNLFSSWYWYVSIGWSCGKVFPHQASLAATGPH